jgi:hypothetical protein
MSLSQRLKGVWTKARKPDTSALKVGLEPDDCAYLALRVFADLGISMPIDIQIDDFFDHRFGTPTDIGDIEPASLLGLLAEQITDGELYFECLATLAKRRLKYRRILESQPIPYFDEVGPRALLQIGDLPSEHLIALLKWRKWIFTIDNRAGQETGYVFEPVIASALGGESCSASKSPVRRMDDEKKGRQVDCILCDPNRAYEFKIRVTIAASGQGRWAEELSFPKDAMKSGFTPVLIVIDSQANPKLNELVAAFESAGGEAYLGDQAWKHLDDLAGPTMATFLEKYVHGPFAELLASQQSENSDLPDFTCGVRESGIVMQVGDEVLEIQRDEGV